LAMQLLRSVFVLAAMLPLSGCVVVSAASVAASAASAAVSVAATTVKVGAKAVEKTVELATEENEPKQPEPARTPAALTP